MTTDFSNKIDILSRFKILYEEENNNGIQEFFEFNDIGLPLAYLASEGLCEVSDDGKKYIAETWDMFLSTLDVKDTGFSDLDEILARADKKP